mmetsp:Transcript_34561/g.78974  ORF Transcript_34561/g.78974 Transcript_34561/m.78974 type:complete len:697 (-) Transcript_34561:74-2164(-)
MAAKEPLMDKTYTVDSRAHVDMKASLRRIFPILEWLPKYPLSDGSSLALVGTKPSPSWVMTKLLPDLSGGLLLGCILEAQSLAHAGLCGVRLINGPYSCILPPIFYVFFGTSVHSSIGTGGLVSLLTGEQLAHIATVDERTYASGILTLEVGMILALMGICNLGFFVRFISKPVLSGFVTASAILIILSQIAPMLGLPEAQSKGGIVHVVLHHLQYLAHMNTATFVLSAISLTWLMNAKRLKGIKKAPALKYFSDFKELLLLVLGAVFCKHYNAQCAAGTEIHVVGEVPLGLPELHVPIRGSNDIALAKELFPAAVLVALVVFLSSFAGAKKFGLMDGYQVRAFNELLGLGFANMAGAFMCSVPTQIGLSRMGIARGAGIKSQVGANLSVGIIVALITAFFSQYLYHVPRCLLNAIIVNGASHLTEFDEAETLYKFSKAGSDYSVKMRAEIVVWLTGLFATLFFGALNGMLVAVGVSILLILAQVSDPRIVALGYDTRTVEDEHHEEEHGKPLKPRPRRWRDRSKQSDKTRIMEESNILVFRLEGPLFFANADQLQEWLEEEEVQCIARRGTEGAYEGIIFSAGAVSFMDTTAVEALKKMIDSYTKRKIPFFYANTFGQVGRLLTKELDPLIYKCLGPKLAGSLDGKSSIDDFVALTREYIHNVRDHIGDAEQPKKGRRSVVPLRRCGSTSTNAII